jgi:transcriptional regulator with XRE-family HTH domain
MSGKGWSAMHGRERHRERTMLAAALRDRREAAGLSRREVADRSGLSYPYVSQLENGDREPSLDALSRLAAVFKVPADELLKPSGAAATAPAEQWHANPAYAAHSPPAPPPASARPRARARSGRDRAVEDAYAVLLGLPPPERLDAAGALLARCLRDAGRSA